MQQKRRFSFYAFAIAIVFHLIVTLFVYLFVKNIHYIALPSKPIPEKRIAISIKDTIAPAPIKRLPEPKPKQSEKLTTKHSAITPISPSSKPFIEPKKYVIQQPIEPIKEESKPQLEPKREPYKPPVEPTRVSQPKKEQGLYDILSKPDIKTSDNSDSTATKVTNNIQRSYGEKFNTLSPGEQKFILDNMTKMLIISNNVLRRYEPARVPSNFTGRGEVLLEFYLHPNGDISDLKIIRGSNYSMMNDLFLETINLSFSKYPHPEQKTLIRWIGSF